MSELLIFPTQRKRQCFEDETPARFWHEVSHYARFLEDFFWSPLCTGPCGVGSRQQAEVLLLSLPHRQASGEIGGAGAQG